MPWVVHQNAPIREMLPTSDICLCLTKHTRLLYLETICGVIVRLDCVIVWVFSLQKAHDMCVDLLELEQKPIMSVRRIDDNELRVGNVFGEFALLGYCK